MITLGILKFVDNNNNNPPKRSIKLIQFPIKMNRLLTNKTIPKKINKILGNFNENPIIKSKIAAIMSIAPKIFTNIGF